MTCRDRQKFHQLSHIECDWYKRCFCSESRVCFDLRVEFLLKTDSGFPRDAEVTSFTLANPEHSLRVNTHWSAPPVSALARSGGPKKMICLSVWNPGRILIMKALLRVEFLKLIVGIPRTEGSLYSPWKPLRIPSAITPRSTPPVCVLLCFVGPVLGNRYSPGVNSFRQ